MLRKYYLDPSHVIQHETVLLKKDLSYKEQLVAILDTQINKLRSKEVALVKVLWRNHSSEEVTWEAINEVRTKYSRPFEDSG